MYKKQANTIFLGKKIISVTQCHSTNTLASTIGKGNDFLEGTVVIAAYQQAGRGQRGASWIAERGKSLTFSMLLRPDFLPIKECFLLNAVVSLGVYDYLKTLFGDDRVYIKWPNDVLVDGKKLCGILIENQIGEGLFLRSVVGVGLNVNQVDFHGLAASSLRLLYGKAFNLDDVLASLLSHIEPLYIMLQRGSYDRIRKKYLSKLFLMGENHTFEATGKRFAGEVCGVDAVGNLLIEVQGTVKSFAAKSIKLVR